MSLQMCALFRGKSSTQLIMLRQMTFAQKHTAKGVLTGFSPAEQRPVQDLHVSTKMSYPDAKPIPLPNNVDEIDNSKLACFSPQRARDILGSVITSQSSMLVGGDCGKANFQQDTFSDPHVINYDCHGAVSLSSTMQSNVPDPFSSSGKSTHLNMPGGQWRQDQKYIAEDMQNSHYAKVPRQDSGNEGQVA